MRSAKIGKLRRSKLALWCVLLFLVFLSSCTPQQRVSRRVTIVKEKKKDDKQQEVLVANAEVYEAKWSDAPLALDARRDVMETQESTDGLSCVFAYTTNLSNHECLDFYRCQMERLGWQEGAFFSFVQEIVLSYEKPSKRAVVLIRPCGQKDCQTSVRLYIGIKEGSSS